MVPKKDVILDKKVIKQQALVNVVTFGYQEKHTQSVSGKICMPGAKLQQQQVSKSPVVQYQGWSIEFAFDEAPQIEY